jgi:chromosome segregation ATPase
MPHKTAYIERDSRGRERLVIPRSGRTHSHGRKSDRELLNESEEREAQLRAELSGLQTRLSLAQRDQWELQRLREEHQRLAHAHNGCRNVHVQLDAQVRELRRVEDLLADEEEKSEGLRRKVEQFKEKIEEYKERLRLMRRTSGDFEVYRARYEEKTREVEVLKQILTERDHQIIEKEDQIRLAETRVTDRNATILYLKNYLRTHGFRVEG